MKPGFFDSKSSKNWQKDLRNRLKNRKSFTLSYFGKTVVYYFGWCCGKKKYCCTQWREQSAKFDLALEKFETEIDLQNILTIQRLSKFLAKLKTTKLQRRSVRYFRKYAIGDSNIAYRQEIEKKEKPMRTKTRKLRLKQDAKKERNWVLDGCNQMRLENQTEKRIIFEMVGRRIDSDDFPEADETEEDDYD